MKEELHRILKILADLTHNDLNKNAMDTDLIRESGLPDFEVKNYLNELQSYGHAEKMGPRPSGVNFDLWKLTQSGLNELQDQDLR
jgi:DNA-binding IclR family transcriptional regulator